MPPLAVVVNRVAVTPQCCWARLRALTFAHSQITFPASKDALPQRLGFVLRNVEMAASQTAARPKFGLALWGAEPVQTLAANAALAEQVGFESAWIIDSQLLCREVYVSLAACLMHTTNLRVATGVTQPATRHLSVVASAVATLQEMAPGRMMLGLGTGFSSLRTIGKPAARIDELEHFTSQLRTLLNGQAVTFDSGMEGR